MPHSTVNTMNAVKTVLLLGLLSAVLLIGGQAIGRAAGAVHRPGLGRRS